MPTVTVYTSADGSAPSLTGQAGALITVLDAVLVNGYGSKSAAGWAKSFSGTNKAVYRNSATDGTGVYLNIDDSGGGAGGAKEAFANGYETASNVGAGTGQFPTSAQLNLGSAPAGAVAWRKSTTADSTVRSWTIVATNTLFYFFAETGDVASPTAALAFCFGDIFSHKSGDAYRGIIIGRNGTNSASTGFESFSALDSVSAFGSGTISGHFMPRGYLGTGTSVAVGKGIDMSMAGTATGNAGSGTVGTGTLSAGAIIGAYNSGLPYPSPVDGGLYLSPIMIGHGNARRGYLPGAWAPMQDRPLSHNDTYSGTGNLSGKTFLVQWIYGSGPSGALPANIGQIHIETSSTWG